MYFVVCTKYCTAGVDKRVRSTSLYHCRQCSIVLKPRSDRIDYTVVCVMTYDCRRKLWKHSTTSACWACGLSDMIACHCACSAEADAFLFIARVVAYWPAPIHAVAPPAYTAVMWLPARLAVCYSQSRSIFSSAIAFTTAKLRWQQLRYRTVNEKKLKPAILWA